MTLKQAFEKIFKHAKKEKKDIGMNFTYDCTYEEFVKEIKKIAENL